MNKLTRGLTTVAGSAAAIATLATVTPAVSYASAKVSLSETGSSLLYPLFQGQWIPAYQKLYPNVQIASASTGSGTGISQATAGTVNIGASDAYMSDGQIAQASSIVNIPLAISAQQVMYHVPGLSTKTHLNLTGSILAGVFTGKIKYWNDPSIVKINKGVKLPHHLIVPIHRSDSSGDTFLFTQFLSDTDKAWGSSLAYGTTVSWPAVSGEVGAKGNSGIVQMLTQTPYSISYVGISWLDKAVSAGIGYAALQNHDGNFVLPTTANIQTAANAHVNDVPKDERISLIDSPGKNAYPIINFEYAIVNTKQPDNTTAVALKHFLLWAINPQWGGNKSQYLTPVNFLPLPAKIRPLSEHQINEIQ